MSTKSIYIYSSIIVVLLMIVGAGLWVETTNRQARQTSKNHPEQMKTFTHEEVAGHAWKNDCWTIISGEVYDLTAYVNRHPGGDEIVRACGKDTTSLFDSRKAEDGQPVGTGTPHSRTAREQLTTLKIGTLTEK